MAAAIAARGKSETVAAGGRGHAAALDPEWQERLERVCRLTVRTSLILELCGLDKSARYQVKDAVDRCYADLGSATPTRPRGQAASFGSGIFLETVAERYDAAYLLALHAPQGAGGLREPDVGRARALDKRIETYLQYLTNLYPGKPMGRVSFETYCELLKGIRCGGVDVHSCRECGSCHPVPVTRLGSPVCPVCYLLRPRIAGFRQDFERRMEQRRVQRPSRDMQHASA